MGLVRSWRVGILAVVATVSVACADSSAADSPSPDATPSPLTGGLPLVRGGAPLHQGAYCTYLQQVSDGDNTLPVDNGCQFAFTKPLDLLATDSGNYSVSEVVGDAELGVRGAADARVLVVCRLSPRAQFSFWISAAGHWGVDRVDDVHHPQGLVSAQDAESLRKYVNSAGVLNHIQFKCAGGQASTQISLALNVNGQQFSAVTLPMPSPGTPLRPASNPWFVDIGAQLNSSGTLEGTVAKVTLYDRE